MNGNNNNNRLFNDNFTIILFKNTLIASKILNITPPDIIFADETLFQHKDISGLYLHESNEIVLNENWIIKSNIYNVLITIFHEIRHAYQHNCIKYRTIEDTSIIDKWIFEFDNYKKTQSNNDFQEKEYLYQSIEIDAIAFASYMMKSLYDLEVLVPEEIMRNVEIRFKQINELVKKVIS